MAMTGTTFVKKVSQLRQYQKAYFKSKDFRMLAASKKVEAEIDEALEKYWDYLERTLPKELNLF